MDAAAVRREPVPDQRGSARARCTVIDNIGPEPRLRGLAFARNQHGHRRIVGMELAGLETLLANAADDGIEQRGGLACPACQCGSVDVDALRRHHLGLAVERQVMIKLVHDNMGERRETGFATRDRLHRRRCLHNLLARAAGVVGTHGANDAPLHRRYVEHLVAGLCKRTQRAAAIGTGAVARLRFDPAFDAWQMVRQAAYRCGANGLDSIRLACCIFAGIGDLGFAFQFLECQLELSDLSDQLLRGLPETHPLELGKLETQRLDQGIAGRQSSFQLGDPGVFVDEGNGLI